MNDLVKQLEPLLEDDELAKSLLVLPDFKSNLKSKGEKLLALNEVYKIFIPNKTTAEIYNRLYLSVVNSLEKKNTLCETQLLNDNYRTIKGLSRYGVIGGLDSYRLTGPAGIGKTSTIQRCIDLISNNKIIKSSRPYREIIPILEVETVSDCSIKSLLYSILIKIDEKLGTNFYISNSSQRITIDLLLAAVSNALTNHVALLCVDEIERIVENKKGIVLLNYLTQLINQSNVSICFIGTEEANKFFEIKEYLARRMLGTSLKKMEFDDNFAYFCDCLFKYQYTDEKCKLNSEIIRWLYNHSNGVPSMVVSLFVESQKNALINNLNSLDIKTFQKTFDSLFSTMSIYVDFKETKHKTVTYKSEIELPSNEHKELKDIFSIVSKVAYKDLEKAVAILKENITVEYV